MDELFLSREREEGGVEYKLKLVSVDSQRLEELATQMKYRIMEGGGEAIYEIGVSDDGQLIGLTSSELEETLANINRAAEKIGVRTTIIREAKGKEGKIIELLVRRLKEDGFPIHLMVPVLGQVDAGKSTTIGVLCSGELDDGNGYAMTKVARYLHEIKMRRTSSISSHLLGFTENGAIVNYRVSSPLSEAEVFLNSAKVISFVDLGGHERYLRTTLKGIMGHVPDYVMLIVGANAGIQQTTKEHLGVSVALKIPLFVAVTKTDMSPQHLDRVLEDTQQLLKLPGIDKIPILINGVEDAVVAAKHMQSGRIAPIFQVSNTYGSGLELLRAFLNLLPPRLRWKAQLSKPFMMYINDKFNVRGAGVVVSGVVLGGEMSIDDYAQLGPFGDGSFRQVKVRSIHVNRVNVRRALAGKDACFAITNVRYEEIGKGMVLLDSAIAPRASQRFKADVMILYHRTTIREGYEATFHLNTIRQTGRFVKMSKGFLRTGDTAAVEVTLLHHPAYVQVGQQFVFREGHTRGIGTITEVL